MIIWRGLGYLVAVIVFISSLIANFITNVITGSEDYWEKHRWPFALSLIFSAIACWFLGKYLTTRKRKVLVDKETGEEMMLEEIHDLFFISVYLWSPLLLTIALLLMVYDFYN